MAIVLLKPTTPGRRGMTVNRPENLTKKKPEKSLLIKLDKHAGRDRFGRISIRHRGGGSQRKFRLMSTLEQGPGVKAKIIALEYDPNRSAHIALVQYENGIKAYILAAQNMKVDQTLTVGEEATQDIGNRLTLSKIERGIPIYDIALDPNKKGAMVRAAGTAAVIQAHEDNGRYVQLKLPSGEIRRVLSSCYASIGMVSNPHHNAISMGKAGRVRHLGRRPQVRGKAMNPHDHPHGGGEGQNSIGLKYPKTPWGKPALGLKTRRNKRTNKFIIKRKNDR